MPPALGFDQGSGIARPRGTAPGQ